MEIKINDVLCDITDEIIPKIKPFFVKSNDGQIFIESENSNIFFGDENSKYEFTELKKYSEAFIEEIIGNSIAINPCCIYSFYCLIFTLHHDLY